MKKILLSVHPKWCKMIFNGKKTIEVRRNRPKLEPPFEVLVYETKGQFIKSVKGACTTYGYGRGKVIGSFICDEIYAFFPWGAGIACEDIDGNLLPADKVCKETCLTGDEIYKYLLGNGKETFEGYGWHITEPKLFDKPKELSEFGTVCNRYENDECDDCPYLQVYVNSYPCDDCVDTWCGVDNIKPLTRPPQSWCYVEER